MWPWLGRWRRDYGSKRGDKETLRVAAHISSDLESVSSCVIVKCLTPKLIPFFSVGLVLVSGVSVILGQVPDHLLPCFSIWLLNFSSTAPHTSV